MLLNVRASAAYDLPAEMFVLLMVEPFLEGPTYRVQSETLRTSPVDYSELTRDGFGNPQRRLVAPAGRFTFTFEATIESDANLAVPEDAIEHPPRDLSPELLTFTLPSRYCQSDLLARVARDEFGSLPPGGRRALAIADWVRTHVEYQSGSTTPLTSAFDTATERVGVCRDFAHLTIAFCRALGIPARYVSGYCLGLEPPDFHGFAQVYLGGSWHNLDATFAGLRPALVPIAVGRDAADVPLTTLWGSGNLLEQTVEVKEAGN